MYEKNVYGDGGQRHVQEQSETRTSFEGFWLVILIVVAIVQST